MAIEIVVTLEYSEENGWEASAVWGYSETAWHWCSSDIHTLQAAIGRDLAVLVSD